MTDGKTLSRARSKSGTKLNKERDCTAVSARTVYCAASRCSQQAFRTLINSTTMLSSSKALDCLPLIPVTKKLIESFGALLSASCHSISLPDWLMSHSLNVRYTPHTEFSQRLKGHLKKSLLSVFVVSLACMTANFPNLSTHVVQTPS